MADFDVAEPNSKRRKRHNILEEFDDVEGDSLPSTPREAVLHPLLDACIINTSADNAEQLSRFKLRVCTASDAEPSSVGAAGAG